MSDERGTDKADWWRLRKLSREERLGCLCGLVGAFAGVVSGVMADRAEIARLLAANPQMTIDFLPVLPLGGLLLGAVLGTLFGMAFSRIVPPAR